VVKIYAIYDVDGKCYVGSTRQTVAMRLSAHLYVKRKKGQSFFRRLKGSNTTDFFIEILGECNESDRFIMEEFWINELNAVNAYKKASGPTSKEISKKCGKKASEYWKKQWQDNYENTRKMVNKHKTTEFQKKANKAAIKKLYEMKPIIEVICSKTGDKSGVFRTNKELCHVLNLKSTKTAYFHRRGMSGNKNFNKYYFREV